MCAAEQEATVWSKLAVPQPSHLSQEVLEQRRLSSILHVGMEVAVGAQRLREAALALVLILGLRAGMNLRMMTRCYLCQERSSRLFGTLGQPVVVSEGEQALVLEVGVEDLKAERPEPNHPGKWRDYLSR